MKTLLKGIAQKIYLDQTGLADGKTIKLSIIGEDGNPLISNTDTQLKDIVLEYDSLVSKYGKEIQFKDSTPKQYVRLYFFSSNATINPDYYPEDAHLDESVLTAAAEIVPFGYLRDFYLNARTQMDAKHKLIIDAFLADKKGVQSNIAAAQNDLEIDLEMFLTPREKLEVRDNYLEKFSENFWQFQVSYPPIIDLLEFKLKIGNNPLADISTDLFSVNHQMGTIEFVPFPTENSAGYFSYLLYGTIGLAATAISGMGGYARIPNMFHCKYTCGLFSPTADSIEKEGIRATIARKALMRILTLTDPKVTKGNRSENVDGGSASESYSTDKLFKQWIDEENKWAYGMKKRYGKLVNVAVI